MFFQPLPRFQTSTLAGEIMAGNGTIGIANDQGPVLQIFDLIQVPIRSVVTGLKGG